MEYKTILGISATAIALYSYIPYIRDMVRARTKPHAFTWLVWALLTGIAFFGQISDAAGPGAWVTGFTAIVSTGIFLVALKQGEKNIESIDWLFLGGCGLSMLLWLITEDPLLSILLISLIDAFAFLPTFRKSWYKPYDETLITFLLSGIKFVIAIIALNNFTIVTWFYPASLVVMNGLFVLLLIVRRQAIKPE